MNNYGASIKDLSGPLTRLATFLAKLLARVRLLTWAPHISRAQTHQAKDLMGLLYD